MARVVVEQIPQPVQYDAQIRVEFVGESCSVSEVSWENGAVLQALTKLFALQNNERIAAVVITKRGIKAEISRG